MKTDRRATPDVTNITITTRNRKSRRIMFAATLVAVASVSSISSSSVTAFNSGTSSRLPRRQQQPKERRAQAASLAFSTPSHPTARSPHCPQHATTDETQTETEALSDVDARVLRSILEEEKLDLRTEDSVKELLERGTRPVERPTRKSDEGEEKYASKVLNTFANSAFWNSFKAKTDELLDSAKIYLENRIERDSKLLASVGLFAWERAKRDVSRALPESGRSGAAVGRAVRNAARQLAANSSYAKYVPDDNFVLPPSKYGEGVETGNIYDELNTPLDEIRSVTESIRDILSGKTVTPAGGGNADASARRGLRSVAPAGTGRAAERQRRAYQRRKKTVLAREKEGIDKKFRRGVESVTDATAEIKREMSVEGNRAGYRSERAVKALEGRAAAAMLEAGVTGEGWGQLPLGIGQRFFGGGRNNRKDGGPARAELKEAAIVVPVLTRDDLLEEKARLAAELRLCLEAPEKTWLMPGSMEGMNMENRALDDEALRDVITKMVCLRDDLEIDEDTADGTTAEEMEDIVEEIRQMKKSVDDLALLAAVAADYDSAERLKAELFGLSSGDEGSLMASIDELVDEYTAAMAQKAVADAAAAEAAEAERETRAKAQAAANAAAASAAEIDFSVGGDFSQSTGQQPQIVDVEVEPANGPVPFFVNTFVDSFSDTEGEGSEVIVEPEAVLVDEESIRVIGADKVEILMDEDLEEDYFEVKTAKEVSEEEISRELEDVEEKDPPLAVTFLLRSLDVVFFVAEKALLAVPIILDTGVTVSKRLKKENRNGLGKKGWEKLENVQQGRKRY